MAINNIVNAPNVLIQTVSANSTALIQATTIIPRDDTIPQNDEGDEIITVSITPTSATNILEINFVTFGGSSNTIVFMALFQDATVNALSASWLLGNIGNGNLMYRMTAGTTSSTTFKIRCGQQSGANTLDINGYSTSRLYGGVACTHMTVKEYHG